MCYVQQKTLELYFISLALYLRPDQVKQGGTDGVFLKNKKKIVPPPVFQRPEEEEDKTRLEEKEKTRLSLMEEKLTDALTLLLQLRNKVHTQHTRQKPSPPAYTHLFSAI